MHEVSQRRALTLSVIAAVEGIVALVLGAFFAPIPAHVEAAQLATALFIRGFLALIALAAAFGLAYFAGYRIEAQLGPSNADPSPALASAPLVAMLATPGPRRDAIYSGALILIAYWFFTTIYIAALGSSMGGAGVTSATIGSFIFTRILIGLALAAAGAGAGGLGARNAATRRITRSVFTGAPLAETASFAPSILPSPSVVSQSFTAEAPAPSEGTPGAESE